MLAVKMYQLYSVPSSRLLDQLVNVGFGSEYARVFYLHARRFLSPPREKRVRVSPVCKQFVLHARAAL